MALRFDGPVFTNQTIPSCRSRKGISSGGRLPHLAGFFGLTAFASAGSFAEWQLDFSPRSLEHRG